MKDFDNFTAHSCVQSGLSLRSKNNPIRVYLQKDVCTARFIENLTNVSKEDLQYWVDRMRSESFWAGFDKHVRQMEKGLTRDYMLRLSYIFYQPQMILAITNCSQTNANKVLEEFGFIPVRVANNKYGGELISWTYELNGWSN